MKILIVHGWLHSATLYVKLKTDLEVYYDHQVNCFELPGFGLTKADKYTHLLKHYSNLLTDELAQIHYDCVIGHSLGGTVLLRALALCSYKPKVILLSPEYKGITMLKPLSLLLPLLIPTLTLCKFSTDTKLETLIRHYAQRKHKDWDDILAILARDIRRANPIVATASAFELIWDNWTASSQRSETHLILGKCDRIIDERKMLRLADDLNSCTIHVINNIGHTAVLDDYTALYHLLENILQ